MVNEHLKAQISERVHIYENLEENDQSEDNTQLLDQEKQDTLENAAVMCPGGSVECADGQTCCPSGSSSGGYRCCKFSQVSPVSDCSVHINLFHLRMVLAFVVVRLKRKNLFKLPKLIL